MQVFTASPGRGPVRTIVLRDRRWVASPGTRASRVPCLPQEGASQTDISSYRPECTDINPPPVFRVPYRPAASTYLHASMAASEQANIFLPMPATVLDKASADAVCTILLIYTPLLYIFLCGDPYYRSDSFLGVIAYRET